MPAVVGGRLVGHHLFQIYGGKMGGWLVGHHGATAAMGGEREAGSDTEAATRAPPPAPGLWPIQLLGPWREGLSTWTLGNTFSPGLVDIWWSLWMFETLSRKQNKLARVKSETLQLE